MKILLIGGFLDAEVRQHDIFKKDNPLFHRMVRLSGLPERVGKLNDHAPWVRSIINYLETQNDVELHVFGPQIRLKKRLTEYESRGVRYYFYSSEWTSFWRKLNRYNIWKRLQNTSVYFKKVLDKVKPDLVLLSGAENPATSIAVLYAHGYPHYCLCQTVYNNPDRAKYSTPNKLTQDVEKDIFTNLKFFGVYSTMHYGLLKRFNSDATVFKFGYPSKGVLLEPSGIKKVFDFVNFALMHGSRKGTPDSIQALAIVKQKYPNVTLNIVGGCDPDGMEQLRSLVSDLGLEQNVVFTPFFEKRSDLLLHVQKSRFAVLPCKLDHTAGTMSQAMQLGLPMVVYRTTGTPSYNREKQCALIAEKENVEELAQHMLALLTNPELCETLRKNARAFQERRIEAAQHNGERLMANFRAIIDYHRNGTPIPEEQLFNPERDD